METFSISEITIPKAFLYQQSNNLEKFNGQIVSMTFFV